MDSPSSKASHAVMVMPSRIRSKPSSGTPHEIGIQLSGRMSRPALSVMKSAMAARMANVFLNCERDARRAMRPAQKIRQRMMSAANQVLAVHPGVARLSSGPSFDGALSVMCPLGWTAGAVLGPPG